ncbi:hypothetical protein ACKWTF_002576 [Chironomus riparius]
MASQRFFRFFTTERGKKFMMYTSTIAGLSAFCIKYLPHTLLAEKHKEIVASYQNGIERKVSETLEKRLVTALNSLKITDSERDFFVPFIVSGFDLYSIGSTKFRDGCLVGIPVNYSYTASDEIPRTEITVRGYDQVDWSSNAGKLLQEGLVLSEPEQIFGICREILELKSHKVLFNALYPVGSILLYYSITSTVNTRNHLFKGPLSLRLVMYSIVGLFSLGIYCFVKDFTQVALDKYVDETLANLGANFLVAGLGFYDKILKKNMAIKNLTNTSELTAMGNINSYFRTKTIPLTDRKMYFQKRLKEFIAEEEKKKEIADETK